MPRLSTPQSPHQAYSYRAEVGVIVPQKFLDFLEDQLPSTCIDRDFANDWTPWLDNFFYDRQTGQLMADVVPVNQVYTDIHFRLGFQKEGQQRILRLYRNSKGTKRVPRVLRFIPQFKLRHLDPSTPRLLHNKGKYNCGRIVFDLTTPYQPPAEEPARKELDTTVGLEDIKNALILEHGAVIGIHSQDNRRLTTRRLTEGDVQTLRRIFCRDD